MNPQMKVIKVSPSTTNSIPIVISAIFTLRKYCLHNLTQKVFSNSILDEYFIQEISQKMESTFLCYKQNYDLLSYADEDIPGVTLPIFSFHLHGTWSGGSQQPFGLSKVDINFGPD